MKTTRRKAVSGVALGSCLAAGLWLLAALLAAEALSAQESPPLGVGATKLSADALAERTHAVGEQQGPSTKNELRLTLEQCLRRALEKNHDVRLARQAIVQGDADVTRARSAILPFVGTVNTYTRLDKALTFPLGPEPFTFMYADLYTAGVVVRQPLFAGGRLNAAYRASQRLRDERVQESRSVEDEIIFQVARAYRAAQVAAEFQKVAAEAVSLLETHEHDVAILVREGANPQIDLLRTRTELANSRKELNAADNAVDLTLSALKNLVGIGLEEPVILTEPFDRSPRPPEDLSTLTQKALLKRPELSALRSQLEAARQALKGAKGEYLPTVAVGGRYEYMKGDIRDLQGGLHWTLALTAEMPVWNWGETRSKVKKAQSQVEEVSIQIQKIEDAVRLEARQAFLELGKSEKNIDAATAALTTAQESFRLARSSYQAGEGTNTEVLEARTALSRARANYAQALFDYDVALAALHRAVGEPGFQRMR
jgi:outer membrane protein